MNICFYSKLIKNIVIPFEEIINVCKKTTLMSQKIEITTKTITHFIMFLDSKVRDNIFEIMDGIWKTHIERIIMQIESEQGLRSQYKEIETNNKEDEGKFPTIKSIKFDNVKFSHHVLERKRSQEFNEIFNLHFAEILEAHYETTFEHLSSEINGTIFISKHYVSFICIRDSLKFVIPFMSITLIEEKDTFEKKPFLLK